MSATQLEKIGPYEVHPAASVFALLPPEEEAKLLESVCQGYDPERPVTMLGGHLGPDGWWVGGLVLDGRNRLRAALKAPEALKDQQPPLTDEALKAALEKVRPTFVAYEGNEPEEYVWRANCVRRHLDPGQRVLARLDLDKLARERKAEERRKQLEAYHAERAKAENQKVVRTDPCEPPEENPPPSVETNREPDPPAEPVVEPSSEPAARHAPEKTAPIQPGTPSTPDTPGIPVPVARPTPPPVAPPKRDHAAERERTSAATTAKAAGTGTTTVSIVRRVARDGAPELVAALRDGLLSTEAAGLVAKLPQDLQPAVLQEAARVKEGRISGARIRAIIKKVQTQLREERKAERVEIPADDRFKLHVCPIAEAPVEDDSVDWIITDPPYPREFLPVYADLGRFAARVLKPGGGLCCMVGQSYLPEILHELAQHLTYRWTMAYLTPGGQAVQVWDRKINTFWKPLLLLTKGKDHGADWLGDVTKSATNDNDKAHHKWGQSESGMRDIIERLTMPGQVVCDPFVGGGTTGVVAVTLGRRFVGIDIDEHQINETARRLADVR